jgi:DNA (cytosine-5)-methyltransferase 1
MSKIKVVDLFAGPGGLGEGFSGYSPRKGKTRPFNIVLSAEKTLPAVKTLRLRTFYRLCRDSGAIPNSYYDYLRGAADKPFNSATEKLWKEASAEAQPLELGTTAGDRKLNEGMKHHITPGRDNWVLIGGPPCQAYSLVGRARNKGITGYDAEKDNRHFLYKEYLKILAQYRPAAFVMENVKGILSSKVGGARIFPQILQDLASPDNGKKSGVRYRIHSLVTQDVFQHGDDPEAIDPRNFIIRSEDYGVPQARHRVILLGIREDGPNTPTPGTLIRSENSIDVRTALHGLPELRSGLSRKDQDTEHWKKEVSQAVTTAIKLGMSRKEASMMKHALSLVGEKEFPSNRGGQFIRAARMPSGKSQAAKEFLRRMQNPNLHGYPNHFARGHMPADLARYLYAASYAEKGVSPKASDYPKGLAPNHKNWNSGNFADRFRVQCWDSPSTTIVSHISKDGHYFIHPDPSQCRSLTVREAARLQTFPDDYFFEGNRTEQYVQVGNAVPPLLAEQIAELVFKAIS